MAINACNLNLNIDTVELLNIIYPVGSYYISSVSTDPHELFGVGSWVQIKDKFILAAGDTYKPGTTGGNATHTHKYGLKLAAYYGSTVFETDDDTGALANGNGDPVGWQGSTSGPILANSAVAGSSTSYNSADHYTSIADTSSDSNMPPYLTAYVWRRTA